MENIDVKVTPQPNGLLMVERTVTITDDAGRSKVKEETYFPCRCGHSKSKPYCDGSHEPANCRG